MQDIQQDEQSSDYISPLTLTKDFILGTALASR